MNRPSVVIVGAGIAGLAAAFELTGGAGGPHDDGPIVTILDASEHVGGALQTTALAGATIDLGADGFLATRPEGLQLVRDADLGDLLVPVATAGASIYLDGALTPLPKGLVLGVPTNPRQVRSLRGLSRRARRGLWRDWLLPRRLSLPDEPTLGAILRGKLGDAVVDELIEPMIGGIQAGRVDDLAAREVFPGLLQAVTKGGSLQKALTPTSPGGHSGPAFCSLRGGLGSLPPQLADVLRGRGVTFRLGESVTAIRPTPAGARRFEVDTPRHTVPADHVMMATSGRVASQLLRARHDATAALAATRYAGAAMVTFAFHADGVRLPDGTGVLVPLHTPSTDFTDSLLTTAVTFLDRKWPLVGNEGLAYLRVHAGRSDDQRALKLGDGDLRERLLREFSQLFGPLAAPLASYVQRWPEALPQYEPGHAAMVARARDALWPEGISLVGLTYDGVGVPATIGSARAQARDVLASLRDGRS